MASATDGSVMIVAGLRVDEDRPDALGSQRAAGLGPGVVELGGLADHDRARPEDQDRRGLAAAVHQPRARRVDAVRCVALVRLGAIGPPTRARQASGRPLRQCVAAVRPEAAGRDRTVEPSAARSPAAPIGA